MTNLSIEGNRSSRRLTVTPSASDIGSAGITITVSDEYGGQATAFFSTTVQPDTSNPDGGAVGAPAPGGSVDIHMPRDQGPCGVVDEQSLLLRVDAGSNCANSELTGSQELP